jgi:trans-aconitate methyltransferase
MATDWDQLAVGYRQATAKNADLLRHNLLVPTVLKLCGALDGLRVVDLGCGTGALDATLVSHGAAEVFALDFSAAMIRQCRSLGVHQIHASRCDIERNVGPVTDADLALVSLVLHLVSRLDATLTNTRRMVRQHATVVVAIPHPAFHMDSSEIQALGAYSAHTGIPTWAPTHRYDSEHDTVNTFGSPPISIPMIHRPLGRYFDAFCANGFRIDGIEEPTYSGVLPTTLAIWNFLPPFVFFRLTAC